MEIQQDREKLISSLEFERRCRQQDNEARDAEVHDLQEQIGEYEEETMQLNNQLYQMKLEVIRLQKMVEQKDASPTKSIQSVKAPRVVSEQPSQAVAAKSPKKSAKWGPSATVNSYDNAEDDLTDASQMRREFKEAFTAEEDSIIGKGLKGDRLAELEEQVKDLRTKFKKEEATRKQFQEIAKRKDEEIKKVASDVKQMEEKYKEEIIKGQKQKTMIMQRDNKI